MEPNVMLALRMDTLLLGFVSDPTDSKYTNCLQSENRIPRYSNGITWD